MKYTFPAVFTQEGRFVLVNFPDLESCYTYGESEEDALTYAEDALNLVLADMEDEREAIPTPSPIETIAVPPHSKVLLVHADTQAYRDAKQIKTPTQSVSA